MMSNLSCGENKKAKDKDYCQKSVCISDNCWIERPRFFNGQLLTDVDLKAGQNYVIEKNKLHNRYLHGWGVVCGLKVKCYPCCEGHGSSGKVVVEPGYAIDCCGNDIVVCDEQEFDVVKRVNEMKQKKMSEQSPCETGAAEPVTTCSNGEEKYYLVLSYKEEDAKPATALKADDPCSIQRCVPSRTKECFKLDLVEYCTLEPTPDDNFFTRAMNCFSIFTDTWKSENPGKEFNWINLSQLNKEELKKLIREYYKALPYHVHCDVLDQLEEIGSIKSTEKELDQNSAMGLKNTLSQGTINPEARRLLNNDPINLDISNTANVLKGNELNWYIIDGIKYYQIQFHADPNEIIERAIITYNESLIQLIIILFQLFIDCICQALLNPCPTCNEDDVVILATITVKKNKIEKICNLSRKWVISFPTLFYWLPFNKYFGDMVEKFCCWMESTDYVSLPNWMYSAIAKAFKNNFAMPKNIIKNIEDTFKNIPTSLFKTFDPANISLEGALNKKVEESEDLLTNLKIQVVGKEKYEPSFKGFSLDEILSTIPFAHPGSKVIQLVDDNDNVVGFRTVKEKPKAEPTPAAEEVSLLKTELEKMNKKMAAMEKELKEMKKKTPGPKAAGTKKK